MQNKFKRKLASFLALTMILSCVVMPTTTVSAETTASVSKDATIPVVTEVVETIDFEFLIDELDKDPLQGFEGISGTTVEVTADIDAINHTEGGKTSMKIIPLEGTFNAAKVYPEMQVGKKVSVWIYDDMASDRNAVLELSGNTDGSSDTWKMYAGIRPGSEYNTFSRTESKYNYGENAVKRTKGWHNFVIDMTVMGEVTFSIDGTVAGVLKLRDGEYGMFKQLAIVNFWTTPEQPVVYVDDVEVSSLAPAPTNPVVDDLQNTFDWTFDGTKTDIADYEYSLDGGVTFNDCIEKPLYIGNKNYAVGDIKVRVKSVVDTSYTFPTITNDKPFTFTYNVNLNMEEQRHTGAFNVLVNTPAVGTKDPATVAPGMTLTTKHSHSGLTSLWVNPDNANNVADNSGITNKGGLFRIGNTSDEKIQNKVLTMWVYDDTSITSNDYKLLALTTEYDEDGKTTSNCMLGFNNNGGTYGKTHYVVRTTSGDASNWNTWGNTGVERTTGWHQFQWDYTVAGQCTIYIDGKEVRTYEADGFDAYYLQDTWAQSSSAPDFDFYVDDITITDSRAEVPVYPVAPTNPVVNDAEDTFGWTYVSGKDDVSLYEYSVDNGATFQTCTSNPQSVPEKLMEAGTVMVRLSATETDLAGVVLRSTEKFTDPASIIAEKIEAIVDFAKYANPKDYTDESWKAYADQMTKATEAIANGGNLQDEFDALVKAQDELVFALDNQTMYTFADQVVPVEPVYGKVDWDKSTNLSFLTEQAYKIDTEDVNGSHIAKLTYNFPKPLVNKKISFQYWDAKNSGGQFEIRVGNSKTGYGNIVSSMYASGASSTQYMFYDIIGGQQTNQRTYSMGRREEIRTFEINMTSDKGTQIYMDTILVFSNPNLFEIDYLDFYVNGSKTYISVDELEITEKNEALEINYPSDTVDIGYYDTYEMNIVNYELTTPHDYPTTDTFTYKVADPSVAYITKNGSIQPVAKEGTTTATITALNGATKTITVNVHDYRVTGVELSDALITQEPNFIDEMVMTKNSIDVIDAIIEPAGATILTKEWTSSDESVATVIDGQITAVGLGTATITVKTVDGGHTDSIEVKVVEDYDNYGIEIFVAPNGNDITGDGSIDKPFKTVERARDEARTLSQIAKDGLVVYFREGEYTVSETIALEIQDSGDSENPVKYSAYKDEKATFTGSFKLAPKDFEVVSDASTLDRIQSYAQGKVYVADISEYLGDDLLKILGVGYTQETAINQLTEAGINLTEPYYAVTFGGEQMTLSRWPNPQDSISGCQYPGFARINSNPYKGTTIRNWFDDMVADSRYVPEDERDVFDSFRFKSSALTERMKTWNGIKLDDSNILDENIWYEGYTGVSYTTQTSPIRSIAADGSVKSHIAATYWASSSDFARIYVYNLLQELDVPGEWYIDTDEGKIYIMPLEGSDMTSDEEIISISTLADTMFTLENTQNINFDKINISNSLGSAFAIVGGSNNVVSNSTVQNISKPVGSIVDSAEEKGTYNGFEYCTFKDVNGGITITASKNYDTLEPGHNFVNGSLFDNYQTLGNGFNPAVVLHGVGNVASSNEICNGPNNAIMWQGNDHVIEFNDIHHIDLQTTDTSAIYTGRNTVNRGTVVKNNYIHHTGKYGDASSHNIGIYLDDMSSGIRIYDNVIEEVTWAVFVNGGQDNYITNNTIKDCTYGVIATDWSYLWRSRWYQHGYGLYKEGTSLEPTTFDWWSEESPYAKYPHLQTITSDYMNNSIYNKVINNNYTGTDNLFEYRVRGCQPDTVNVLKDWYFDKGNYAFN